MAMRRPRTKDEAQEAIEEGDSEVAEAIIEKVIAPSKMQKGAKRIEKKDEKEH
jgi:hypothetical protein